MNWNHGPVPVSVVIGVGVYIRRWLCIFHDSQYEMWISLPGSLKLSVIIQGIRDNVYLATKQALTSITSPAPVRMLMLIN